MFCSQCGQENPDTALSCARCGNALSSAAPIQPVSYSSVASAAAVAPAPVVAASTFPPEEAKTDGKAIASLIFGILGILTAIILIGILLGIPAVILGHLSRSAIKKSMGKLKGAGMALAGLIMGYISLAGILMLPFILIAAIAIPNLLKSRMAANEASAVSSIRTIATASLTYQAEKAIYPPTLDELRQGNMIDPALASGIKYGYRFTYTSTGDHFFVVAVPVKPGSTGDRNFCAGDDAVVRSTKGEECTLDSSPL